MSNKVVCFGAIISPLLESLWKPYPVVLSPIAGNAEMEGFFRPGLADKTLSSIFLSRSGAVTPPYRSCSSSCVNLN